MHNRFEQGHVDLTHHILYQLHRHYAPGGNEEKITLQHRVMNPQECFKASQAYTTLKTWELEILRMKRLGMTPLDITQIYLAAMRIFGHVFTKCLELMFAYTRYIFLYFISI